MSISRFQSIRNLREFGAESRDLEAIDHQPDNRLLRGQQPLPRFEVRLGQILGKPRIALHSAADISAGVAGTLDASMAIKAK
ncbi:hypothetical protein GOA99_18655 [Sinorhizobium meliloti]|nr:hypothetical protein [Sinorhizobium meliloti]